jgi:glycosyltransferase involved in cell wall biosynthesis
LIVGDGPDASSVCERAAQLGVADRVHMLGQIPDADKHAALAVADAFVSASQHEGFGLVFLEAMAFGLPVVCYDHGGQTDFLTTGETGAVIKLNDTEAFASAVVSLCRDRETRARIAHRNRALVENYFIDVCAARYEEVFSYVIEARAKGGRPGFARPLEEP